jgi:DNA-binding transcriptional LysR family regulator
MNLKQLHQFIALAETGNFHRAAEQLHMAQPPLSISIRKLEEELGSALFDRTSTGVVLTPAGKAMLESARATLFHAEQCRQAVRDTREGVGGLIRLGFVGSATYELLPRLIPSFRDRYPKVGLEFYEATSAEILEGLATRRFDAGLLRYPCWSSMKALNSRRWIRTSSCWPSRTTVPWRSATPSLCPRQRMSLL